MNSTNEIIAAIDIGTTKIVAIAGKVTSNGELQILGLEKTKSTGVVKGVIQNINQTIDAIREVVEKLQQNTNLKIDKAYVGIAGQHIRSLKNRQFKYIQNNS
ncbi:MAG: cell division protein FtsA, partial [Ancylomarina sp.]